MKKKPAPTKPESLGQRIARLRKAKGSQRDFARATAIPLATIRNIEQSRNVPTIQVLIVLAMALGTSLDALVDGIEFED